MNTIIVERFLISIQNAKLAAARGTSVVACDKLYFIVDLQTVRIGTIIHIFLKKTIDILRKLLRMPQLLVYL